MRFVRSLISSVLNRIADCPFGRFIAGMVKSWSLGDLPTTESALDLPKAVFDELANACAEEYNKRPDFSPDPDPKAPTAD